LFLTRVCAAHAVVVGGKVIEPGGGADNDHRVGGDEGAEMSTFGWSRPP